MDGEFMPRIKSGDDTIDKSVEISCLQMEIMHADYWDGMFVGKYLDRSKNRKLDRILDVLRKVRSGELSFKDLSDPQYSDVFPLYPPNRIRREEQKQGVEIIEEWD